MRSLGVRAERGQQRGKSSAASLIRRSDGLDVLQISGLEDSNATTCYPNRLGHDEDPASTFMEGRRKL